MMAIIHYRHCAMCRTLFVIAIDNLRQSIVFGQERYYLATRCWGRPVYRARLSTRGAP